MATDPATDAPPPPSKPAFLRRVRIRNYKSIAFCDVALEPLTILVGRNATGKSNFLDALGFLRDVVVKGVREAVHDHGGRDAVLCRSAETPRVRIEIETSQIDCDEHFSGRTVFAMDIDFSTANIIKMHGEHLRFEDPTGHLVFSYDVGDGGVSWDGDITMKSIKNWRSFDRPLISFAGAMLHLKPFDDAIRNFTAYNFSPDLMRRPQLPTSGEFLKPDGSNLASVYKATLAADPSAAKRAATYLNAVARSVKFAGVVSAGGYEVLEFDTSENLDAWNGPPREPQRFPAANMSDGTLRAFAAVMAAFQTVKPYGSPSLVAIEEPETALHPAAMRALVAALDEATWRTQILITTHSPDLLDAEEVKPANVRIVQLIDGHTVIGPVDEASVEIVTRELNTLAGLERGDQLFPDLDDQDRQKLLARTESGVPV